MFDRVGTSRLLAEGDIEVVGRILGSSNNALFVRVTRTCLDPEPDEIAACAHFLDRQIAIIEPKLIATLGRHSMNKFFPGGKITRIHGVKGVKREGARVYLPLFHPAYVLRNMNAAGDAVADIRLIPRLIKRLEQRLAEEAAGIQAAPASPAAEPEPPEPLQQQMSLL